MPQTQPAAAKKVGLEKKNVQELKERAAFLKIVGRSGMKKEDLVKAIRAKNGKKI